MKAEGQLDPTSLVARIIAGLQANPEAQRLLLCALLTNEFLGMPARLDRIEKDIAEIKADVSELKTGVARIETDVAQIKGSDLETHLHRRIRALANQALNFWRPRVVQSPVQEDGKRVRGSRQGSMGRRPYHGRSGSQDQGDGLHHARAAAYRPSPGVGRGGGVEPDACRGHSAGTADVLGAAFAADAEAVVVGYAIAPPDADRAAAARVKYLASIAGAPELTSTGSRRAGDCATAHAACSANSPPRMCRSSNGHRRMSGMNEQQIS